MKSEKVRKYRGDSCHKSDLVVMAEDFDNVRKELAVKKGLVTRYSDLAKKATEQCIQTAEKLEDSKNEIRAQIDKNYEQEKKIEKLQADVKRLESNNQDLSKGIRAQSDRYDALYTTHENLKESIPHLMIKLYKGDLSETQVSKDPSIYGNGTFFPHNQH